MKFILTILLAGISFTAFAARTARVMAESTQIFERPVEAAKVIRTLKKGTPLVASNFPTENFHKVRLADGTLGWVKTLDVTLGELPEEYR